MAGGPVLAVARGASLVADFQAATVEGDPVTSFNSGDALSVVLWDGGASAPTPTTAAAEWLDAPAGTWRLSIDAAASAALEPARHRIRVDAARGLDVACLLDGSLDVAPGPVADAPPLPTPYCSAADVLAEAPWLAHVQVRDQPAGFLLQRVKARRWLDGLVAANYRAGGMGVFNDHSAAAMAWGVPRRPLGPPTIVLDWLRDDRLIATPGVVAATVYKTVEFVARAQVGVTPAHAGRAAWYARLAEEELDSLSAVAIDLDGDGRPDLYVPLTASNTLFT